MSSACSWPDELIPARDSLVAALAGKDQDAKRSAFRDLMVHLHLVYPGGAIPEGDPFGAEFTRWLQQHGIKVTGFAK